MVFASDVLGNSVETEQNSHRIASQPLLSCVNDQKDGYELAGKDSALTTTALTTTPGLCLLYNRNYAASARREYVAQYLA